MGEKNYLSTNRRQKEFYETKHKNLATRVWSYFRNGLLNKTRKNIGIEKEIFELHKSWISDLKNKKVLDLGCYSGNTLSLYLAANSKKYIGIDLSEKGIANLNKKLVKVPNAEAIAIDFFSPNFTEKDFDLIYAYGVLHHFKNTDLLIDLLNKKLANNGEIISYDPLKTSVPIKLLRAMYRPFQTDKDWEWPFSKNDYYKYEKSFKIKGRRAVLGKAKWFFLLNFLPYSSDRKKMIAKKWHKEDWKKSKISDKHMFDCMHLTMLMQKRN